MDKDSVNSKGKMWSNCNILYKFLLLRTDILNTTAFQKMFKIIKNNQLHSIHLLFKPVQQYSNLWTI